MKRAGHLMERIVQSDNLYEAFLRAVRGKARSREAQEFRNNIDDELHRMADDLAEGRYRFGNYHRFTVFDPKKRTICAAPFRDRVAMHAMMRICHPVFEGYQVYDSYASRIGKGQYKAIERARQLMRADGFFLKMDVCHFFGSIHHEVMLGQLNSLFKDRLLMCYFEQLIRGYEEEPGRGLPIGNLTSQYFANHYLAVADHYLKEQLRARAAIRYMDDMLLLGREKRRLLEMAKEYRAFVEDRLCLNLHHPVVNKCRFGIPFLGYVIFPHRTTLSGRSRRRFRNRLAVTSAAYHDGHITEADYHNRLAALYAFIDRADIEPFKRKMIQEQGLLP